MKPTIAYTICRCYQAQCQLALTRGADTTIIGFPGDAFASNGGVVSVVAFVVFAKVDFLLASGAREASRTVANRFPAQCSVRLTVILTLVAWAVVCVREGV